MTRLVRREGGAGIVFNPMIAVAPNGTVGVSYASFRAGGNAVSYWLVQCSASCTANTVLWI